MKRYALLRLENNANRVIMDTHAVLFADVVEAFNRCLQGVQLDEYGYGKLGDVTFCVAEYFEPFYTV